MEALGILALLSGPVAVSALEMGVHVPRHLRIARAVTRTPSSPPAAYVLMSVAADSAVSRTVVVTDMDETLITRKSTGYIIAFLVRYRAFLRLACALPLALVLIPLSKVSRSLAVRLMYWLAFRGVRVDKAQQIASTFLSERYVRDLQDPAASAVLAADESFILTASPEFMARPWLERFLSVPPANVFGAALKQRNGRFTGATADIPIGEAKAELLRAIDIGDATTVGYGDHPTDVPFLLECSRGVLVTSADEPVQPLDPLPDGIECEAALPLEGSRVEALLEQSRRGSDAAVTRQ
uniref:LNS2/PITP domain-containing protein n=1 Tax=Calcidiscus leptoporus TaxID=127549 RepID=A0A7S0NX93_9EUKA|mmetsp:Transcript_37522/g.87730  ORF Transcript_37522/g.87730 Transcript_37522/m.87730 type:complete len:296 (+) Transcript_37522:11-898(+)